MDNILEMRGITKVFPGVKALDDVTMSVRRGEIHALCGENGAGKSTLMKILSSVYPYGAYEGEVVFEGETKRYGGVAETEADGIIIIHQELALVPLLSIAENIFLGNERAAFGVINWRETRRRAAELARRVGLSENPDTLVGDLGLGKQQLVEIAKALSKRVKLLILDEPTSSLNDSDSDALLELLAEFRREGITSIMISHKLNEIARIADRVTVLRDGAVAATLDYADGAVDEDEIVRHMVGRSIENRYPPREPKIGETVMEVRNWTVRDPIHSEWLAVDDVSFHVRKGEVLGVAGIMGAGRTELAMSLFGRAYGRYVSGDVLIRGEPVTLSSIRRAIDAGIAYVTEDRKALGLVLDQTIRENVPLANLAAIAPSGVVSEERERAAAERYRAQLNIRCSSIEQEAVNLSGGNQQKVVLSKWLFSDPQILILDEPTRGIDVGAKYEIYTIIRDLAAAGRSVIVISSELPELLGVTDRIYVMNEGRFVGELATDEADQEKIMSLIIKSGG